MESMQWGYSEKRFDNEHFSPGKESVMNRVKAKRQNSRNDMPGSQSMYHPRASIAPLGDEESFSEEEENVSPELRKATTALGFDH